MSINPLLIIKQRFVNAVAFVFGAITFASINQMIIYNNNPKEEADEIFLIDNDNHPQSRPLLAPISEIPENAEPWAKYIATKDTETSQKSNQGEEGGEWTWCTHLVKYGPNFDRGFANFISGILRPESALEFGCGIGLYINYIEHFSTAENKTPSRFIGIEPESMINAGVFSTEPWKATQLAMNIFDMEQEILDSLETFDVVYSSEVAEHFPVKHHEQMYDFLVKKTKKFLVFGAANPKQGGTGHLRESMKWPDHHVEKFKERGMIYSARLTERLRKSCFNTWDKGKNTFVMITKDHYDQIDDVNGIGGLKNVEDIFPKFHLKYVEIKQNEICE